MITFPPFGSGCRIRTCDLWHMKPARTTSSLTRNSLAVLGGNDPHSSGVTSQRASVNTLGPNLVGALRFEQRRSETTDLQSAPDTITGLSTQNSGVGDGIRTHMKRICSPWPNHSATHQHGRGYRTRTCACRNQNPMPYQLGESPTNHIKAHSVAVFATLVTTKTSKNVL